MQGEGRRRKLLDDPEQGGASLAGLKKVEGMAAASATMARRMRAGQRGSKLAWLAARPVQQQQYQAEKQTRRGDKQGIYGAAG